MIKSILIGNLIETPSNQVSSGIKIIGKVNRVGHEAQLIVEYNGIQYEIRNIRMPTISKHVLPLSLRNPLIYLAQQKLSASHIPASCRVEPTLISTFDNKTYSYELNNCYHLLFADRSGKIPVAVLAKSLSPVSKEVKILAGSAEVIMTPVSTYNMKIQVILNGQQQIVDIPAGTAKYIDDANRIPILDVKRFQDSVYLIEAVQEDLWVLFDGKHVEISASALLRSRSLGLCGDLNGENTADLKTPERCIMSRPQLAAYSYMIQESCQGIPSQDLPKYQKEKTECVKHEIIPTPMEQLNKILSAPITVKPLIQQHLVERIVKSGKMCISKQTVKICSKSSDLEAEEPKPIKVQPKMMEYTCEEASHPLIQGLEQRAKSGEIFHKELMSKSTTFSKTVYEPVLCHRQV